MAHASGGDGTQGMVFTALNQDNFARANLNCQISPACLPACLPAATTMSSHTQKAVVLFACQPALSSQYILLTCRKQLIVLTCEAKHMQAVALGGQAVQGLDHPALKSVTMHSLASIPRLQCAHHHHSSATASMTAMNIDRSSVSKAIQMSQPLQTLKSSLSVPGCRH
jgi:hypothetical protein